MNLQEVRFDDLSQIKYRMFIYEFPKEERNLIRTRVLILEFAGIHGIGSEGNNDSLFMEALINTAVQVWFVEGLLLNLSKLSYEWGNTIGNVLLAGKKVMGSSFPTAVVVSELCRSALESASPFYTNPHRSSGQSKWLFNDVETALSYIKEQTEIQKSNQEKKLRRKLFRKK